MFQLIVPANYLRDGQKVYKPTGSKPYTLRYKVPLYGAPMVMLQEGMLCIVSDSGINIIDGKTPMKVIAEDVRELEMFVQDFTFANH